MTYYRILKYLKEHGLDDGQAHYVRNMIRELVNERGGKQCPRNPGVCAATGTAPVVAMNTDV